MNEIAKCPVCGEDPHWKESFYSSVALNCCEVRCETVLRWNQYAAAMELARAFVWEAEQKRKGLSYMTKHKAAKKRVLEVFWR